MTDLVILPCLVIPALPQWSRAGPAEKWHGVAVFKRVSSICSSMNMESARTRETCFFVASNRVHSSTDPSTLVSPSCGKASYAPSSWPSQPAFLPLSARQARLVSKDYWSHPVLLNSSRKPCERLITIYRYVKEPGNSPDYSMTQPRHSLAPRRRNCSDSHVPRQQ
jgi:hypothetical protein